MIKYKEMIANNKLSTFFQKETQDKEKDRLNTKYRKCVSCGKLITDSLNQDDICLYCKNEKNNHK